ncbi:hypothetical protein [Streptomyces vietnamensis]|uniref:Uncharacterized protein n=1 Tax=Streptomyces vietnamensis TaxID=362257 RepID=A0A0B5IFI1_9ACTN|nr:hypothetical protein [Streptomyces vietnamensis]AJF68473.1 hypothetical protein SVTN_33165 [Streptomyces vietnamensis]
MGEQKQHRTDEDRAGRPRTTPAEAEGESGDEEARREADEAVSSRGLPGGRRETGERQGATGREATDPEGAGGHTDKHQRPGVGREEQTRGHDG